MFSLVVSVIAVLLVVALALAALYYGGVAFNNSGVKATAATLINQASQIEAAASISEAHNNGWPINLSDLAPNYLASMPVPPANAYAEGAPKTTDWAYYLPGTTHHIVLSNKIRKDVCMEVNRERGFVGIPMVWDGTSVVQCFGTGIATAKGGLAFTLLYTPNGATSAQQLAALGKSVSDANAILAVSPVSVLSVAGSTDAPVSTSVTTPGYPVLCPSGDYIAAGACLEGAAISQASPETVTPPPESVASGPFSCINFNASIDVNGKTNPDGSEQEILVAVSGPGAVAEFGNVVIPRDVESNFPSLTGSNAGSDPMVYFNFTPGPTNTVGETSYTITGATGKKVRCNQYVVQSFDPAANGLSIQIDDGPRTSAGGYPLNILAYTGNFVVGPDGQKPIVYWYDKQIPAADITVVNSTTLRIASVPSFAEGGGFIGTNYGGVMVENYASNEWVYTPFQFSDEPVRLSITDVSPSKGPDTGGTIVTITGTGFTSADTVTFRDHVVTVLSRTATEIKVASPPSVDVWGWASIVISHPLPADTGLTIDTVTAREDLFTYMPPEYAFDSASPNAGSPGDIVIFRGTNVTADTEVYFGANRAEFYMYDETYGPQLYVRAPAGSGSVSFTVINRTRDITTVVENAFTYN